MKYYELKYRLPMSHSSSSDKTKSHHHVIEVTVFAELMGQSFVEFNDMDMVLKECLDVYRNQYLNDMEEFHGDTSIENLTEVFFAKISKRFLQENWKLTKIEAGENPLRVYIIGTRNI